MDLNIIIIQMDVRFFNEKFGGCSNRRYNMIKYRIYAD